VNFVQLLRYGFGLSLSGWNFAQGPLLFDHGGSSTGTLPV
jgi:hypothetical protein